MRAHLKQLAGLLLLEECQQYHDMKSYDLFTNSLWVKKDTREYGSGRWVRVRVRVRLRLRLRLRRRRRRRPRRIPRSASSPWPREPVS